MSKEKKTKSKELEELRKKSEEYLNGWKRAQADYQNLKKEKEREKEEWIKYANAGLVIELLPVYDNLKLALEHIPKEQREFDWVVGIEHIKNQLTSFLETQGVEEVVVREGDEFDPEVMEAVEDQKQQDNKLINQKINKNTESLGEDSEVKKNGDGGEVQFVKKQVKVGYRMRGKVIVPVKVIVG